MCNTSPKNVIDVQIVENVWNAKNLEDAKAVNIAKDEKTLQNVRKAEERCRMRRISRCVAWLRILMCGHTRTIRDSVHP